MGYFELFFAWSRVQFKTVFGTVIRELFARMGAFILLVLVYFDVLSPEQFIYALVLVYAIRCVLMAFYALYLYKPKFSLKLPYNSKEVILFCVYIFLSGSAATILLEIDKTMIPQYYELEEVAFYGVGVYIALVIGIPSRAMQQIVNPMTAKALNHGERDLVQQLYTDSSFYLLMIGGLLFLCININIESIYELIGKPAYQIGIPVVMIISSVELIKLFLGNANSILTNSKFYKVFFYVALAMAFGVVVLNKYFIPSYGIAVAAWATFIVVAVSAFIKILFLSIKMNYRLSLSKSLRLLLIIVSLFFAFDYLPIWSTPFFDIVIKCLLIASTYFTFLYFLGLVPDLNSLKNNFSEKSK
jgi:O-antigen/teichoic acid export membrane protein